MVWYGNESRNRTEYAGDAANFPLLQCISRRVSGGKMLGLRLRAWSCRTGVADHRRDMISGGGNLNGTLGGLPSAKINRLVLRRIEEGCVNPSTTASSRALISGKISNGRRRWPTPKSDAR